MLERAETLNNQAIVLASDGAYKEAIACYKRAIILEKNNYLLWYNLGLTYRDFGKLNEACNALETAAQIAPENEEVLETLATLYLLNKNYEKVREICLYCLKINSFNPHFWNLMGVVEFQCEDYARATDLFEQAVFLNPYYLDALYNLRDTYSMVNNKQGEEECSKRIAELPK